MILTIYNMNGGKFKLDSKALLKREKITQPWIEKAPDNFYFYLDIDFKHNNELTNEQKYNILNSILSSFNLDDLWISKCSEDKGYHVNFPEKVVNKTTAKNIVSKLESDYVDSSAYNVGLRILFAPKNNSNRSYIPFEHRKDGIIDKLECKWYPQFLISAEECKEKQNTKCFVFKTTEGCFCLKQKSTVRTSTNYCTSNQYGIYKMKKYGDKTVFLSYNKNCGNLISGTHKSNNIYYELQGSCLVQKCWCRCPTKENRKYGYCSSYSSEKIQLGMLELYNLKNNL